MNKPKCLSLRCQKGLQKCTACKPKPKYNIGDKVWCVVFGEAIRFEIEGVWKMQSGGFRYYSDIAFDWIVEKALSKTKEELIKSL